MLDNYNQHVVDSYIRLYKLRRKVIEANKIKITDELYDSFIISSLNLFDIAIFSLLISNKEKRIYELRKELVKYIQTSGYELLFRNELKNIKLTFKRRFLYRLAASRFYMFLCMLVRYKKGKEQRR